LPYSDNMNLPFFYTTEFDSTQKQLVLDEDTSRHVVSVLRMQEGEKLNLTDGKGNLLNCEISDAHKKHCLVKIEGTRYKEQGTRKVSIAISLVKNTSRFEWFLEKATEIGVHEIIPLICERTEKQKFRYDRMKGICISAMLQSQQSWLPVLHEPKQFNHQTIQQFNHQQKFIAHCIETEKKSLSHRLINSSADQLIIIGPEGDFTPAEINLALENNFIPVGLGETRLRTETAGIVSVTLLKNF
jgi:16S rRNA (uracil1498-N3)-methyltransferase